MPNNASEVIDRPERLYPGDEIDLLELFAALWRGKWIIIVTTFIFAILGVIYALSKPDIYQSSVLLAPANELGGASKFAGQLGGLASLAGINLDGGSSNQTVIAKEILQSHAFLADFIQRHELQVPLKAIKSWDQATQEWRINEKLYNPKTKEWQTSGKGKSLQPTDWDLVNAFKANHLSLSEDKNTGMIRFSVKSLSPTVAREWAQWLVEDLNEHMRKQDIKEGEARIAYLEQKLNETIITSMQQVFYQLIENETRTLMLAHAQDEYVFKTIDPAIVPQEKSEPKRAVIFILATLVGGMIGVFIVLVIAFATRSDKANVRNAGNSAQKKLDKRS